MKNIGFIVLLGIAAPIFAAEETGLSETQKLLPKPECFQSPQAFARSLENPTSEFLDALRKAKNRSFEDAGDTQNDIARWWTQHSQVAGPILLESARRSQQHSAAFDLLGRLVTATLVAINCHTLYTMPPARTSEEARAKELACYGASLGFVALCSDIGRLFYRRNKVDIARAIHQCLGDIYTDVQQRKEATLGAVTPESFIASLHRAPSAGCPIPRPRSTGSGGAGSARHVTFQDGQ